MFSLPLTGMGPSLVKCSCRQHCLSSHKFESNMDRFYSEKVLPASFLIFSGFFCLFCKYRSQIYSTCLKCTPVSVFNGIFFWGGGFRYRHVFGLLWFHVFTRHVFGVFGFHVFNRHLFGVFTIVLGFHVFTIDMFWFTQVSCFHD